MLLANPTDRELVESAAQATRATPHALYQAVARAVDCKVPFYSFQSTGRLPRPIQIELLAFHHALINDRLSARIAIDGLARILDGIWGHPAPGR